MIIATTKEELSETLDQYAQAGLETGLVPTMGALHQGHRSLLDRSLSENQRTICSIFVNPTQFNDPRDLKNYPRPVANDIRFLDETGTDLLFMPSVSELYGNELEAHQWHIDLHGLDRVLEGSSRPGHFQGVTQVVNELFTLVSPRRAYFGQKDYQQFAVISQLVEKLKFNTELVRCPVIREMDGLAMSSRNVHLNSEERADATRIWRALTFANDSFGSLPVSDVLRKMRELLVGGRSIRVDYVTIADPLTLEPVKKWKPGIIALIAIWAGNTRLIDNRFLSPSPELNNSNFA